MNMHVPYLVLANFVHEHTQFMLCTLLWLHA